MMNIEELLEEAIGTGEVLKIKYYGGSSLGAIREIAPIQITGSKVRARCYTSNAVKLFMVDKIQPVDYEIKNLVKMQEPVPAPAPSNNLVELYNEQLEWLESLGWDVVFEGDEQAIKLYKRYKNGKRYKRHEVCIFHSDVHKEIVTTDVVLRFTVSGVSTENVEKKQTYDRQWHVYAKQGNMRLSPSA